MDPVIMLSLYKPATGNTMPSIVNNARDSDLGLSCDNLSNFNL